MAKAGEWSSLAPSLSAGVLKTLTEDLGFSQMTPVQAATLPLFLKNADVAVEFISLFPQRGPLMKRLWEKFQSVHKRALLARSALASPNPKAPTGSGKTIAFLIPIVEKLTVLEEPLKKHDVGAIVLTPTRELARQIMTVLEAFLKNVSRPLTSVLLVGGTDINEDLRNIAQQGANIIVASPGRLDYVLQKSTKGLNIKTLEVLVMDEADRLLDMGFSVNIESILSRLPKQRRTGLFSATQTKQVEELVKAGMRNPVKVTVNVKQKETDAIQTIPASLNNYYAVFEADQKLSFLIQFLLAKKDKKVIVYFLTGAMVDYFWKILSLLPQTKGLTLLSLHGKIPANKRNGVVEKFSNASSCALFCTDVAARGLDFNDHPVDWIVQYDPPQDPAFFVHRIGRTARMGLEGNAVAFLMPNELAYVEFLQVRGVPITKADPLKMLETKTSTIDIIPSIKAMIRKDRDLFDKAIAAFLSYIRAYTEHQCSFIFILKDVDFGKLLHSFAMLRVPGMPELKGITIKGFEDEDTEGIPYKDKKREEQRLEALNERKSYKADKEKKKAQKQRKWEQKQLEKKRKLQEFFASNMEGSDDDEDIMRESRLLKKLRKGKITEEEFEEQTGDKKFEKLIAGEVDSAEHIEAEQSEGDEAKPEEKEEKPQEDDVEMKDAHDSEEDAPIFEAQPEKADKTNKKKKQKHKKSQIRTPLLQGKSTV